MAHFALEVGWLRGYTTKMRQSLMGGRAMKTMGVVVLVALAVVISTAARSDVVVFKNGTYQEGTVKSGADGSITIPQVLRPYMGGKEKIEKNC